MSTADDARAMLAEPADRYVRVITPRLRKLLYLLFALFALLGANAIYLGSVTALNWYSGAVAGAPQSYENHFYQYMFLLHLVLGLLLIVPFLVFGVLHLLAGRQRRNRRAVKIGYALFAACVLLLISGVLLMRVEGLELRDPAGRRIVYWLHVACPLAAIWLYWLHRLAGPRIRWSVGGAYLGAVAVVVAAMVWLQAQDPRAWNQQGPAEGVKYFEPSLVRTASGAFIPSRVLMNDEYCKRCHQDVYDGWFHSAHHFSSFNNPAYLAAVRETRAATLKRDGSVQASRWCAGCHDPVPFLSGAFDDPQYDDVQHPTSQAGITCTACHAITHVNSVRGNGDYTIEEPLHYPFAFSDQPWLRFINETLVKAKPEFHKKTFLKPLHRTAEFYATCHKVHLPKALTAYKDFLRGQNHYDSYLLSGVSGHGAQSFYYPQQAETNCNGCHMPPQKSLDFGARQLAGVEGRAVHNHLFLGANTALPWMRGDDALIEPHRKFLAESMRVDLFGVREGADVTGKLHAPLRPRTPLLRPGQSYLLETVIRTLTLGHLFTQGTVDSNQVWLEIEVRNVPTPDGKSEGGGALLAASGAMDGEGRVDPNAHFVNNFVIDRQGDRIARRNAQDIFVSLYNHQIPPGAGQTVHYRLDVPTGLRGAIEVTARLKYRKFDKQYMDFVAESLTERDRPVRGVVPGRPGPNRLPVVVLAEDRVRLPIADDSARAGESLAEQPAPPWPEWQRWNDYGIGMLLKGTAELRQAAEAFQQVDRYDGPLNLARVLLAEGNQDEAGRAVEQALRYDSPPPPPWTVSWLSGVVNLEQGNLAAAQANFEKVLTDNTEEMQRRGFDFSLDYRVLNLLGRVLFEQAKQQVGPELASLRAEFLEAAAGQFQRTLQLDPENVEAHHNLHLIYAQLERTELAERHRELHVRYKPDDSVEAIALARQKYPAANHAAENLVIYELTPVAAPSEGAGEAAPAGAVKDGGGSSGEPATAAADAEPAAAATSQPVTAPAPVQDE